MSTIAFRIDDELKRQMKQLAKLKGINLSALIKLYLTKNIKTELSQITVNGMTVADELELLAQAEEGGNGKIFKSAKEYVKYLKDLNK